MSLYKYIRQAWKNPKANMPEIWRERLLKFRREPVTVRIERPTRLDRARSLGYKAKPGFVLIRQRVDRGGRLRPKIRKGRRSKRMSRRLDLHMNYQWVAEQRAVRDYPNCEVLNSYEVAKDGLHYWFEVILVDRAHPAIKADKNIGWVAEKQHKGRVYRGLTSSGRKSRALRRKGKGAEKVRPSLRAHQRLAR